MNTTAGNWAIGDLKSTLLTLGLLDRVDAGQYAWQEAYGLLSLQVAFKRWRLDAP